MWKIIGIPLVLYIGLTTYFYQPPTNHEAPCAELIESKLIAADSVNIDLIDSNSIKTTLPTSTAAVDSIKLYINTYAQFAMQEMLRAKVPASITLGQAVLESRYGTSELAVQANNHFGIKAEPKWDSSSRHCIYSYEWSQKKQRMFPVLSCFRQYETIKDCFIGHSDFLVERPYYTKLFTLKINNFKAWARGLQKAGYATDPNYAKKLIAVIIRYQLQKYDALAISKAAKEKN